jgi:Helix-turn-helix domain
METFHHHRHRHLAGTAARTYRSGAAQHRLRASFIRNSARCETHMSEQPAADMLPAGESFPVWQLARLFHVDRQHLVNLIESGEIKVAIDLRGKTSSRSCIRVPRNSLIEFLQSRKVIASACKLGRRGDKQRKQ